MKNRRRSNRRLARIGCVALALVLSVGTVPFLRGFAAEERAIHFYLTINIIYLKGVNLYDL